MIFPDAKKAATVILSRSKGEGDNTSMPVKSEVNMDGDDSAGLTAAAEDIMQAFHDKSVEGLKSALKAFVSQCDDDEPEGDE